MSTRLYFTTETPSYVPPTIRGDWNDKVILSANAWKLGHAKGGTNTLVALSESAATTNWDALSGRFISEPLTGGSIAAVTTGSAYQIAIARQVNNASMSSRLHFHIYFTVGDTDAVRTILEEDFIGSTAATTTMSNFYSNSYGTTPAAVIQPGDRMVIEFGFRAVNSDTTTYTTNYRFGGTAGDLPAASGTTSVTTHSPWIEFNSTVFDAALVPFDPYTDRLSQPFTASNSKAGEYHIYASHIDDEEPIGLMVQLHGDGAYEYDNPTDHYSIGGPRGILDTCKDHNMILIVAHAPDWTGTTTWWEDGAANGVYAHELIQQVGFDTYDIDSIWLNGYSGGAQFITQYFLPAYPSFLERGGGAIMFGGGGPPLVTEGTYSPTLKAGFPLHWYTGQQDIPANSPGEGYDGYGEAQDGAAHYLAAGFTVTTEWPLNTDHNHLADIFGLVTEDWMNRVLNPATYADKAFEVEYTFESGTETTSGTWTRVTTDAYAGVACLQSLSPANSASSDAVFDVPAGALTMRYMFKISSELDGDVLRILVGSDDIRVASGLSPYGWRSSPPIDLNGATSVTFRYQKDASTAAGSDKVWIDNVSFEVTESVPENDPAAFFAFF